MCEKLHCSFKDNLKGKKSLGVIVKSLHPITKIKIQKEKRIHLSFFICAMIKRRYCRKSPYNTVSKFKVEWKAVSTQEKYQNARLKIPSSKASVSSCSQAGMPSCCLPSQDGSCPRRETGDTLAPRPGMTSPGVLGGRCWTEITKQNRLGRTETAGPDTFSFPPAVDLHSSLALAPNPCKNGCQHVERINQFGKGRELSNKSILYSFCKHICAEAAEPNSNGFFCFLL